MMVWLPCFLLLGLVPSHVIATFAEEVHRETREESIATPRIVGGVNAEQGRHPYMASLRQTRNRKVHVCGATLIAPNILLTAAHCYQGGNDRLQITMNPYSIDTPASTAKIFNIEETRRHPLYGTPAEFAHDFMLLKMDGKSTETPIRLNTDPALPLVGDILSTVGWGKTAANFDTFPAGGILQIRSTGQVISNAQCRALYAPLVVTDNMMCADYEGACQGDSGGPLFESGSGPSRDVQYGITSWGIGCNSLTYPGVYSRISAEWDWIRVNACDMALGDVPDYFDCPGPTAAPSDSPTPLPSPMPSSSPSMTFAPTKNGARITIRIFTDEWPAEVSWELIDTKGNLITKRNAGEIMKRSAPNDYLLVVNDAAEYTLTVFDSEGDGVCCRYGNGFIKVFFGDSTNDADILADASGSYTSSTSLTFEVPDLNVPTPSPTFSLAPSFSPTKPGSCLRPRPGGCSVCGDGLCVTKPNAVFEFPGQPTAECGLIEEFGFNGGLVAAQCNILKTLSDFVNVCGCATGTSEPTAQPSRSSPPSVAPTLSVAPSTAPSLTSEGGVPFSVVINTDGFPEETSWSLQDKNAKVLGNIQFGTLTKANSRVTKRVYLKMKNRYTFILFDRQGDGNCCRFGNGNAEIYFGTIIKPDALLVTLNGTFAQATFVDFIAQDPAIDGPGRIVDPVNKPFICFPGESTCKVEGKGEVQMRHLKLGDRVLADTGKYEPIYSFGHIAPEAVGQYLQIRTPSATLELSRDHMVFVDRGRSIPASRVKNGDKLVLSNGELSTVRNIRNVTRIGAYAPFTQSGTVVVNGVKASSYVAFQDSETLLISQFDTGLSFQFLAFTFEGPHRTWCRYFSSCKSEQYTDSGVSLWVNIPHNAATWYLDQNDVTMFVFGIPVVLAFTFMAYPLSFLCFIVAIIAVTRLSNRIKTSK